MVQIDLSGKAALITGGGQGLGEAITRKLHAAGASVAVNYFADPEGVNRARADAVVASLGSRAAAVEADVRDRAGLARMIEEVRAAFGRLDIVVNNAGILSDRTLRRMAPDEWQRVIDTNLTGVFNVCNAVVDALPDGGRIVNLSSISGFLGFFGQANYAAAKAGVVGLTKVLSREVAKRSITVNAVAPGVMQVGMGKTIPPQVLEEMLRQIPLGRFGEAEDVADAVLFLCSGMAGYITGQVLHVSGGWWV